MRITQLVKKWWMNFARALGYINTRVILTLFYVMLGIPAVVLKLFRKDLLDRKFDGSSSYWKDKLQEQQTIEQARRQF